ncbi:NUDIX domain-containing protein [Kitasatospora sp. NPDC052896]|uniref:NUDIX domain-containing protein n=1 Tax=Kitasatospora sp. NPDC052896 TaxID=3364061 RepID=UPI0037CC7EB3
MASQTPINRQEWLKGLPRAFTAASAFITNPAGEVLLVKSYRPHHQFPGGVIELSEGPEECAVRETSEELGIELRPGRLLCVSWLTATGTSLEDQPGTQFFIDLGTIPADTPITLQEDELDSWTWASVERAAELLGPVSAQRLQACYAARADGLTRIVTASRAEHLTAQFDTEAPDNA